MIEEDGEYIVVVQPVSIIHTINKNHRHHVLCIILSSKKIKILLVDNHSITIIKAK